MPDLRFFPATALPFTALVEAVNRGYEGYVGEFSPETTSSYADFVREQNVDLTLSLVALAADSKPVGLALLARRGDESWIGDFALAPQWRGIGAGQRMMETCLVAARRAGVQRIRLDVSPKNNAARRLYTRNGFQEARRLHNFSASANLRQVASTTGLMIRQATQVELLRWTAATSIPPAWDHELAALLATPALRLLLAASEVQEAALLAARARDDEIDLLYFALRASAELDAGRALLAALGAQADTVLRASYVPDGSPLLTILPQLGFHEDSQDIEMELTL